jgi:sugar phosphate isomerase/epimerase
MLKICSMVGAPDLRQQTLAIYSGDIPLACEKLSGLGYDSIEIMTRNPKRLNLAELKGALQRSGLELAGFCTGHVYAEDGLGLVGPDPAVCQQALERFKDFADVVGDHFPPGTWINIGRARGDGLPNDMPLTKNRAAEVFRELAAYGLSRGVRWVLEPVNSLQAAYINTTQDGIDMAERVNRPNFGLMLDVFHMNIEDADIYASLRQARSFCWAIHLTDNNRKWPGNAHLDLQRIIAVLDEIGYNGHASLEIMPWPDADSAARLSIEYLRRYVPRGA